MALGIKKVGIYTPYLDSFGGGERYVLTVAEAFSVEYHVDLLLDSHQISLDPENLKNRLGEHLNLDLSKVHLVKSPLGESGFFKKIFFLRNYDLLFYVTDGSIFYSTAKKNIIHFQVPFKNTTAKNVWGKLKLSTWNTAVCNSKFTENIIKDEWDLKTDVLYPPVDVEKIKPLSKKKQILTVGRFNSFIKPKKHEEMISVFKDLVNDGKIEGWKFILAGSVEGDDGYIDELKELAKGFPIEFYPNCPFDELVKLYGESSIYWHAMGLGEDDPKRMEHFGISTVEAMAGGCVPIVINKGGQTEIVEQGVSGLLWDKVDDLKERTVEVISDHDLWENLSKNAKERSKIFSKESFKENLRKIVESV